MYSDIRAGHCRLPAGFCIHLEKHFWARTTPAAVDKIRVADGCNDDEPERIKANHKNRAEDQVVEKLNILSLLVSLITILTPPLPQARLTELAGYFVHRYQ